MPLNKHFFKYNKFGFCERISNNLTIEDKLVTPCLYVTSCSLTEVILKAGFVDFDGNFKECSFSDNNVVIHKMKIYRENENTPIAYFLLDLTIFNKKRDCKISIQHFGRLSMDEGFYKKYFSGYSIFKTISNLINYTNYFIENGGDIFYANFFNTPFNNKMIIFNIVESKLPELKFSNRISKPMPNTEKLEYSEIFNAINNIVIKCYHYFFSRVGKDDDWDHDVFYHKNLPSRKYLNNLINKSITSLNTNKFNNDSHEIISDNEEPNLKHLSLYTDKTEFYSLKDSIKLNALYFYNETEDFICNYSKDINDVLYLQYNIKLFDKIKNQEEKLSCQVISNYCYYALYFKFTPDHNFGYPSKNNIVEKFNLEGPLQISSNINIENQIVETLNKKHSDCSNIEISLKYFTANYAFDECLNLQISNSFNIKYAAYHFIYILLKYNPTKNDFQLKSDIKIIDEKRIDVYLYSEKEDITILFTTTEYLKLGDCSSGYNLINYSINVLFSENKYEFKDYFNKFSMSFNSYEKKLLNKIWSDIKDFVINIK